MSSAPNSSLGTEESESRSTAALPPAPLASLPPQLPTPPSSAQSSPVVPPPPTPPVTPNVVPEVADVEASGNVQPAVEEPAGDGVVLGGRPAAGDEPAAGEEPAEVVDEQPVATAKPTEQPTEKVDGEKPAEVPEEEEFPDSDGEFVSTGDVIKDIEIRVKREMKKRRKQEAKRDAERKARRAAEQARIDAVLKSVDDSKAKMQDTVDKLQATVDFLTEQRDSAAESLARTEDLLARAGQEVDDALDRAIRMAGSGGLLPDGIPEDDEDLDMHVASAASTLGTVGYAIVDNFVSAEDVFAAFDNLGSLQRPDEEASAAGAGGAGGAGGPPPVVLTASAAGGGELIGWIQPHSPGVDTIQTILGKVDHLVLGRLAPVVGEGLSAPGLRRHIAQASVMPSGASRPPDATLTEAPGAGGRILCATVFLNPAYDDSMGGMAVLRQAAGGEGTPVTPAPGRLVLTWCDGPYTGSVEHQAASDTAQLYALRVWFGLG